MPSRGCGSSRGCGRVRGCGFHKKKGRVYQYYVANKALGITERPPNGFTRFLTSLRGSTRKYAKRRLTSKTAIFRMDLLRDKYRMLPSIERSDFERAAADDFKRVQTLRAERLARPASPTAAVADCKAAVADCEAAVAAAGTSLVGLTSTAPLGNRIRLLDDLLGKGSYGNCYAAEDVFTGERFCCKFPKDRAGDKAALSNEYAFMSRLRHPNVLQVYALLLDGDSAQPGALVLPLLAGNLWKLVVQSTAVAGDLEAAIGASEKRSFALQVLAGLGHVHGHGVVHLDLKPDNVLVQPAVAGYTCCIADFGLAQATKDFKGIAADPTTRADSINALEYRPFDLFQLSGRSEVAVHPRHDMWAFGCLVFDVMQSSPRLWDRHSDTPLRLMSGVSSRPGPIGDKSRWLLRDGRMRGIDKEVAGLIRKLQPDDSGVRGGLSQKPQRARYLGASAAADEIRQWGCVGRGCGSGVGGGRGCGEYVMLL